jgi:hypothetical protein
MYVQMLKGGIVMLSRGNFDDLSGCQVPASEQPIEDETKKDEEDNYIRGRTDIVPDEICCHCNKYVLQVRDYQLKSVKKHVLYCENDGYLCIICRDFLPDPPEHPQQDILICPKGHHL